MLKKILKKISITAFAMAIVFTVPSVAQAQEKFKVMWSIYVGWAPWGYINDSGIMKKWADKYGIEVEIVQINDYIESINQFTNGEFQAGVMTNLDTLTIPSASGVDTTALVLGTTSNGNDAILLKGKTNLKDIKGQNVNLVELSISHYLLARALESVSLSEKDVTVVNTSDADIASVWTSDSVTAAVAWNPQVSEMVQYPKSSIVYDSSSIPGEIMDLLVIHTDVLQQSPEFAKAITGAWYEAMSLLAPNSHKREEVIAELAKISGTDVAGYKAQMKTTKFFYDPVESANYYASSELSKTIKNVSKFSFNYGLLGDGAEDETFIGVNTPVFKFGDQDNVKLRFNPTYMQMMADGDL